MIWSGLKNFFKSLKHFFTPLGTLALGVIFGLSVFLPVFGSAITTLVNDLTTALEGVSIDGDAIFDTLVDEVTALDWSNVFGAVRTMFDSDWLSRVLQSCVQAFLGEAEWIGQIDTAIADCVSSIGAGGKLFLSFCLLGIFGGFLLLCYLIRREIARRSIWKYFLASLIDSLLTVTLISTCVALINVWAPSIAISALLSSLLYGFVALLEAYLIQGRKQTDFKHIVNFKNILLLAVTNILILLLVAVFTVIAILIFNALVGLVIGLVLMEIAFIVDSLNAEAYVKSVVEKTTPAPLPDPPSEETAE